MSQAKAQQQISQDAEVALDEAEVSAYLQAHPDFLNRHPELLATLAVPHDCGNAASLIERQVEVLRRSNQQTRERTNDLIAAARDNEWRMQQLNKLAQVLIGTESGADVARALSAFLTRELDVDAVHIALVADAEALPDAMQALTEEGANKAAVDDVFRRGHPICGRLDAAQVRVMFPESEEAVPQSAALIPLGEGEVRGVLTLASRDAERFGPAMGTLFLGQLGELVTAACRRHLGATVI